MLDSTWNLRELPELPHEICVTNDMIIIKIQQHKKNVYIEETINYSIW